MTPRTPRARPFELVEGRSQTTALRVKDSLACGGSRWPKPTRCESLSSVHKGLCSRWLRPYGVVPSNHDARSIFWTPEQPGKGMLERFGAFRGGVHKGAELHHSLVVQSQCSRGAPALCRAPKAVISLRFSRFVQCRRDGSDFEDFPERLPKFFPWSRSCVTR